MPIRTSADLLVGSDIFRSLKTAALTDGGFSDRAGGQYRSDATAWAVLAFMAGRNGSNLLGSAQARLAGDQRGDGSISISPLHPQAYWPTAVAILAWQGSSEHRQAQARAIEFLLGTTGRHWSNFRNSPLGHDPSIPGWPWIADTHSWVEPTALAVIALRDAGYTDHPRVDNGIRMLMDRQLPHGGWNYGNTTVFGQKLLPAPESTGATLHALTGQVPRAAVEHSLNYLSNEVAHLRTPIALGWSLLALNSWGASPQNAPSLIADCLKKQERYGAYDTTSLCLLVLPLLSPNGLLAKSAGAV